MFWCLYLHPLIQGPGSVSNKLLPAPEDRERSYWRELTDWLTDWLVTVDTEDHTVGLAAPAEVDELDLARVLAGLAAEPLLFPENGTLDDVGTGVAGPALRGTAGLETTAATEWATAALLPVEKQPQEDSRSDDERENYRTEGIALNIIRLTDWLTESLTDLQQVVDGVHHGPGRPVLVVGRVEQGAEGVVENGVDGSIDETVHAGVGETVDGSVEQPRHVSTDQ